MEYEVVTSFRSRGRLHNAGDILDSRTYGRMPFVCRRFVEEVPVQQKSTVEEVSVQQKPTKPVEVETKPKKKAAKKKSKKKD